MELQRQETLPIFPDDKTFYFYHSSHGEIILDNPIVDSLAPNPVYPFTYSFPQQKIEIIIKNRAAISHTINVGDITNYGDARENFNPDLFEDYLYIQSIGGEINLIEMASAGGPPEVFYDLKLGIKKDIPNIKFTNNKDFNMGTIELFKHNDIFYPEDSSVDLWDQCIPKPLNPSKIEYLHDNYDSLLGDIVKNISMKPGIGYGDDIKIILYNSTCLYIPDTPLMYESFPIWGQFYSSYLAAGPEKMARQQVGKIDYLVQQNKNKGDEMKQYETDRNYDGDYDSDILKNFEIEIKTIRDEIKKEVDIQNKFSKQSEDIYKKMKRDGKIGIHKSRLYRRPQGRSFKEKMSGGIRLKKKTYKRGIRETMIRNELPEDIGEILFNNLRIH
jgi:hypothetical protein